MVLMVIEIVTDELKTKLAKLSAHFSLALFMLFTYFSYVFAFSSIVIMLIYSIGLHMKNTEQFSGQNLL